MSTPPEAERVKSDPSARVVPYKACFAPIMLETHVPWRFCVSVQSRTTASDIGSGLSQPGESKARSLLSLLKNAGCLQSAFGSTINIGTSLARPYFAACSELKSIALKTLWYALLISSGV